MYIITFLIRCSAQSFSGLPKKKTSLQSSSILIELFRTYIHYFQSTDPPYRNLGSTFADLPKPLLSNYCGILTCFLFFYLHFFYKHIYFINKNLSKYVNWINQIFLVFCNSNCIAVVKKISYQHGTFTKV